MNTYSGQQLGNYRLIRSVGRGGFAEVYLGVHRYLETPVAIKILRSRNLDRTIFLQEARLVAHLNHRHIVSVREFDIKDDTPFLVMDYVQGGTLRHLCPRGTRLPLGQVVAYVQQIASALHYTHQQGIVHGDVKPENVLVAADGHVLLSDFGLAGIISMAEARDGALVGTVDYMAPEQFQHRLLPASDQYALGIMAYEWLCGRPPFEGSYIEVAVQHALEPAASLLDSVADLPAGADEVILHALAKEPADRFASVEAFAESLEAAALAAQGMGKTPQATPYRRGTTALLESQPAPAAPSPLSSKLFSRRNLFGLLAGVIIGAGAVVTESILRDRPSPHNPVVKPVVKQTVKPAATATPREALVYVYHGSPHSVDALAWSPNGQYIASGGGKQEQQQQRTDQTYPVQIWRAATGQTISVFNGHVDVIYALAWSPDGTRIASGGTRMMATWAANTGVVIGQYTATQAYFQCNNIFWSSDNQSVIVTDDYGSVYKLAPTDLQTFPGDATVLYGMPVDSHDDYVSTSRCAPDQQYISMLERQGIRVIRIADKQPLAYFQRLAGAPFQHSTSPDTVLSLWSPDSTRIASGGNSSGPFYIWKATSGEVVVAFSGDTAITAAGWSADGRYLASSSNSRQLQIWDAATGKVLQRHARKNTSTVRSIAWSPDGKTIACGCQDGTVELWRTLLPL
ncbi:hypothetical protein KDH_71650 [Dictyobacter sp. S3.2.2.5]|uniref:Protein kinase domain-containing protein n=1 Tax=Dictyobacter halimunensis TaxID=3026934 RepID=A0ABQ6G5F9_9CHLR|nr:hypothetical protein KDH_71650 [Dictyobacter sp. S3.2.2.5]